MHDLARYTISSELEGEFFICCLALCRTIPVHEGAVEAEWMHPCGVKGSTQTEKRDSYPLRWEVWDCFLVNHPDQEYCRYIVAGLQEGFRIGFCYNERGSSTGPSPTKTVSKCTNQ